MPKIAEMREIDGELWVKVERASFKSHNAIQLLSQQEISQLRFDALREAQELIGEQAKAVAKEIYS